MQEGYPDLSTNRALRFHHSVESALILKLRQLHTPGAGALRHIARALVPLPPVSGPVIVRTSLNFKMLVDPISDTAIERALFERGTYEAGTLAVLKMVLDEGDTFIDVGANIGLMSLAASQIVGSAGHVLAFEPHPDVCQILRFNRDINEASNIQVHEVGLGAECGRRMLYERPHIGRGGASFVDGVATHHQARIETLDHLTLSNDWPHVRCLKIDVEGWELQVLEGAASMLSQARPPVVIVECNTNRQTAGGTAADIFEYLTSRNRYEVFTLRAGKNVPSRLSRVRSIGDLPHHDNLFCFPRSPQ